MVTQRLKGRVTIVTGGALGLGRAIAARLAEDGARVVIADKDPTHTEEAARSLGGLGIPTDVSESRAVNEMVHRVVRELGEVHVLVNNAGIHIQKLAKDLSDDEWDAVLNTNARGTFYCCRAVTPSMIKQENGRIINIATRLFGNPYSSAYVTSKAAVWGFTQCLAVELAPYGITVNALAPGPTLGTGMEKWFRAKAEHLGLSFEEFKRQVVLGIPLGRWCQPSDVAAAVSFLASDEAGYITGELINVTGGWTGYAMTPKRSE